MQAEVNENPKNSLPLFPRQAWYYSRAGGNPKRKPNKAQNQKRINCKNYKNGKRFFEIQMFFL
jgi:hypothetical protein